MNVKRKQSKGAGLQGLDIYKAIRELDLPTIKSVSEGDTDQLYMMSVNEKEYPLSYACKLGNLTPAELLLEYVSPDMNDMLIFDMFQRSFLYAHQLGHEQLISSLDRSVFNDPPPGSKNDRAPAL